VSFALAGARWPAWIGLAAFAAHLAWQIHRLKIGDPALCLRIFQSNRDAGLLLFAGLLAEEEASVVDIAHDRAFSSDDISTVTVHCVVETRDAAHVMSLCERLRREGFDVLRR